MKKLHLPMLAGAICLAFSAFAQDSLQLVNLEEIVISGNKIIERKSDIPHQIDLVLQSQISKISPLTTADALSNSGAVYVQKSQQGGGSPVLRGFEANRILLVVDGVRMNNAIFRAGHLQNSISTDPNVMERIEVLQGAGSVIYGTDAIGGVISFFTKRPSLSDSLKLRGKTNGFVRYSSVNQGKTVHANVNLGSKKWASLTAVTASEFGDLRSGKKDMMDYPNFGDANFYVKRINGRDSMVTNDDPEVQRFSGYKQLDVLQKILYSPGNGVEHLLNFQLSTTTDVPRYDRLSILSNGKPRFAEWYYGPQNRQFLSYELKKETKKWWADDLRFTPAVQFIGESRHDRGFGKIERNNYHESLTIYSANIDLYKQVSGHEIRYGAEVVQNTLESAAHADNLESAQQKTIASRYPDGTYATAGLYFSHRWELLDSKLILSDGIRFSSVTIDARFDPSFYDTDMAHVRQQTQSQNLHLGVVGNLSGGLRLNALLSTGFRNPNIDDLGKTFETNGGDLMVANADLRPEQVFYREIGMTQTIGSYGFLHINAYFSTLTDAIVPRPYLISGQDSVDFMGARYRTLANVNVGKAKVWGIAANGKFQVAPNWILRGNITYTQGRDLTNKVPLDHIPPLYGNTSLQYENAKFFAQADFLFNGMKKLADYSPSGEDNQQYATPDGTPAWQTWNLRIGRQLTKLLRLQIGVENIADLNYRSFASGINAPGRNVVVSLHWGI
ncbi:MAG: TonB-dependent receptor [Saprospiraceae bacterium]|nr:TonB-dependent receptor [Saprospiraceae bacterium]MCF8250662.1 TonB-dependent receptor [Saprospiraceae bacterium]MCF8280800.1 TonB-dependent receptor [Bacteroidales bacterium]MCF8312514.1 TonB-dependent receptor [Saprospiraceae bacterium]MCF8440806.1 TonB-dependent receptor [Saprospiraceae bacterium]